MDATAKVASVLEIAEARVDRDICAALQRARLALREKTPYVLGAKSFACMDCSGLVSKCYPCLPDGVERQFDALSSWLFGGLDTSFVESGDLVFLAAKNRPSFASHVGFVEAVQFSSDSATLIHASQSVGCVTSDTWSRFSFEFKGDYIVLGCAKLRPFLLRLAVEEEMLLETSGD